MAFQLAFALVLVALIANANCDDSKHYYAIDDDGVLHFTVLNSGQTIQIPNNHDQKAPRPSLQQKLTFSLRGSSVNQISELAESKTWNMKLYDQSELNIWVNKHANFTEYYVVWSGQNETKLPSEICFHYGDNNVRWFNTYQEKVQQWPMNSSVRMPEYPFNGIPSNSSQSIAEHLFLTTGGFALMLDRVSPLFLRRDPNNGDPLMCISAQAKAPYQDSKTSPPLIGYRNIKFSIYTAGNIRSAYESVVNTVGSIPKPKGIPNVNTFTYPNWFLNKGMENYFPNRNLFSQDALPMFADELYAHGYNNSLITLDVTAQMKSPYFSFDFKRFSDPKQMIQKLHSRRYKLNLLVNTLMYDQSLWKEHPEYFVQTETSTKTKKQLLIRVGNEPESASPIDFTNQNALNWFLDKLVRIQQSFQLDGFQFAPLTMNGDQSLKFSNSYVERYPMLLANKYLEMASKFGSQSMVTDGHKSQELPLFVRMRDIVNDWGYSEGLRSVIPTVLALSMGGYSFVIPGLIDGSNASEELYIRYVQVQTFLPAMAFSNPPWKYSELCSNITKQFVDLHISLGPTIVELAQKRASKGTPIIRPMWYADPDDVQTYSIDDQFMFGEDILVAPVVQQGAHERMVYLPKGVWIDQKGMQFYGPLELLVDAQLEVLPYFKRHLK